MILLANLLRKLKKDLGLKGSYFSPRVTWKTIVEDALHDYFDENKELIIDLAASKLADSYKRTKAYKEKMDNI